MKLQLPPWLIVLPALLAPAARSQSPPLEVTASASSAPDGFLSGLKTDPATVLAEPEMPRPPYLVRGNPGPFGAPIMRIATDAGRPTAPVRGAWGSDARHVYSKQQPWNADETLISIENRGASGSPSPLILDGLTYEP